jgi:Leucine-rich repeat (LRR) protein
LDVSDNQLVELPAEVGSLTALTCLHLHSNNLAALPENLGELVQLEKLSLHTNTLESVPANLGHLSKLTWLSLNNNKLTHLPEEIFKCVRVFSVLLRMCSTCLALYGHNIISLMLTIRTELDREPTDVEEWILNFSPLMLPGLRHSVPAKSLLMI